MPAVLIPRGIEVLVKKASVDPNFRRLLLDRRAESAAEIGLELDPAEAAMLDAIPSAQLDAIIARTTVDPMSRGVFLGRAAALMLAALGAGLGCETSEASRGIRPGEVWETLYREIDYKGRVTYAIAEREAFLARQTEVARMNELLPEACELARRAWKSDPAHTGFPFTLEVSKGAWVCEPVFVDHRRQRLRDKLESLRADLREEEEEGAREEAQMADLSEAGWLRVSDRKYHEWAAERLFEEKLQALLKRQTPETAGPSPKAQKTNHSYPPTDGIRPDRP